MLDREKYADGTMSPAMLVFPTPSLTRNAITAGEVFEFPDRAARHPYLQLRLGRLDEVAEVLLFLVMPQTLQVELRNEPTAVSEENIRSWGGEAVSDTTNPRVFVHPEAGSAVAAVMIPLNI